MKIPRTYYLIITLLLGAMFTNVALAQRNTDCTPYNSWISAGRGLPGEVLSSTEMDDHLYVLHSMHAYIPYRVMDYGISKWDGSAWSLVTSFQSRELLYGGYRYSYIKFKGWNGDLYLGGSFKGLNGDPQLSSLVKWDGSSWSSARGTREITNVEALEIHNGELHAALRIDSSGWHIMRLHDGNWIDVDDSFMPFAKEIYPYAMISRNGELHVGGIEPSSIGALPFAKAFVWDGKIWKRTVDSMVVGSVRQFFIYNGELYIHGIRLPEQGANDGRYLVAWKNGSWEPVLFEVDSTRQISWFTVHNEQLYGLSQISINTPERTLTQTRIQRFTGSTWEMLPNTDGEVNILESYHGQLFLGGEFTESCSSPLSNIAILYSNPDYGRISGTVYHDINGNCMQDSEEKGLAHRFIEINPGGHIVATNAKGGYSHVVENGEYSVSLLPSDYWRQRCPEPPRTHSVLLYNGENSAGNNFAMRPVSGIQDLRVTILAGPARQGRQIIYAITYENAGTVAMSGTVRLRHDPILIYDEAQAPASRYSQGIADWDFTDLAIGESRTIRVRATVPRSTAMGTSLCSQVEVFPHQYDSVDADNQDSVCVPVTGGYDPNDIQVTPLGIANDGIITPQDSLLTYWVRFQNTGNDTAFKVVVVDTLSSHLDIASIRLGAASHPYSFSIDKSNILTWTFNDIMLPDSNASEVKSHGFFKFSVKLKRDLRPGTEIANQAHIYFDYNAPVATNIVVSTLDTPMGVTPPPAGSSLALYPNPVREWIRIDGALRPGSSVTLRTMLGETVGNYPYDGSGIMTIDVRDLPAGTYLLTAETADGIRNEGVTVIR